MRSTQRLTIVLCLFLGSLLLSGCGLVYVHRRPTSKLAELRMGMTIHQVKAVLGEPYEIAGYRSSAERPAARHTYPLFQPATRLVYYYVAGPLTAFIAWTFPPRGIADWFFLHYEEGRLVQWGRWWDRHAQADHVEERRYR